MGGTGATESMLAITAGAVGHNLYTQYGVALNVFADNFNDTGAGATDAIIPTVSIAPITYTGTNANTYTDTVSLYIQGAPVASTNITFTNTALALWVDDGYARFDSGVIIGDASSTNNLIDDASTGSGTTTLYVGNASITVSSDMRLKTEIEDTKIDALNLIDQMRVYDFSWNDPSDESEYGKNYRGRYMGMLAQETVKIAPWVINDQGGGRDCPQCMDGEECLSHANWQVEYAHLVPTVVKAIQELREEIRTLKEA